MDRVNGDRVNLMIRLEIVVAISLWIVIGLSEREATGGNGESNMITFDLEFVIDANKSSQSASFSWRHLYNDIMTQLSHQSKLLLTTKISVTLSFF